MHRFSFINFFSDLVCEWSISTPTDLVHISIQHYLIQYDPDCLGDWLEIFDGEFIS